MDDFVLANLHESRNEWCARLVSIFTPLMTEGIKSIFHEAMKMCLENDEPSKYLMTFQNLLSRIPKWNSVIVEEERKRIIERSGCGYLEDLITCVHIIQLKVLTCIRVGNKQKKIDISIPKLDHFIHKVYIHIARKVYMNVYLFETNISPLQSQKNGRELEQIIQECILHTIRESIPTEQIIRAYMDESVEHEEVVSIEHLDEPILDGSGNKPTLDETTTAAAAAATNDKNEENHHTDDETTHTLTPNTVLSIQDIDETPVTTKLQFNDTDSVLDIETNKISLVNAPKTIERLEDIATNRAIQRKLEEEENDDDDDDEPSQSRIKIMTEDLKLNDVFSMEGSSSNSGSGRFEEDLPLLDFEELP